MCFGAMFLLYSYTLCSMGSSDSRAVAWKPNMVSTMQHARTRECCNLLISPWKPPKQNPCEPPIEAVMLMIWYHSYVHFLCLVWNVCRYLMGEFFKNPVACLTLASYLITNTGEGCHPSSLRNCSLVAMSPNTYQPLCVVSGIAAVGPNVGLQTAVQCMALFAAGLGLGTLAELQSKTHCCSHPAMVCRPVVLDASADYLLILAWLLCRCYRCR